MLQCVREVQCALQCAAECVALRERCSRYVRELRCVAVRL